jgi:hypothetical protein
MTDKYNKYLWLCNDGQGRDKYRNFAPLYTFAEWLSRQHPNVKGFVDFVDLLTSRKILD